MTRSTFTSKEAAYLTSQMLGRIATVNARGAPRVVPTGFRYNAETFDENGEAMWSGL